MSQDVRPDLKIRPATFPDDIETVKHLFLSYAQSLPIKLDFQGFEQELSGLPGKYAVENGGVVYLAYMTTASPRSSDITPSKNDTLSEEASTMPSNQENEAIGCVGIRPFPTASKIPTCEVKRLYLTPESRGLGVARLLMDVVVAQARQLGYQEMLLDTLSSMAAARRLYEKCGFEEIASYYDSVEDAVFYRLRL